MIKNKYLFVLLFSAAIFMSVTAQEEDFDTAEDESALDSDENIPLSRHERDLAVAESAGIGGGGGGAVGGKAGAAGGAGGGFKKGKLAHMIAS